MDKMNHFKTKVLAKFMVKVPVPSVGLPDYLDMDYTEVGRGAYFNGESYIPREIGDTLKIISRASKLRKSVLLCYTNGVQYWIFPENAEIWS